MALNKQPIPINFAQGIDTKTDPKQIPIGKFRELNNGVFGINNLLQKRNGYQQLTSLPNTDSTHITTFNGNLTATGTNIQAYSTASNSWVSKGSIQPLELDTLPLIRNSVNQSQADVAISDNGLVCTVYTEVNAGVSVGKYVIADLVTGQNIIAPTNIPINTGAVQASPRVCLIGNYFVIAFTNLISATSHLQYISISATTPTVVTSNTDIAASYIPASTVAWDMISYGGYVYVAYNTAAGGQSVKVVSLSMQQIAAGAAPSAPVTYAGEIATMMSWCVDSTSASNPVIYLSYYDVASEVGKVIGFSQLLQEVMSPTSVITSGVLLNLASAAQNGVCSLYYEVQNAYSYDSGIPSNYIALRTITKPNTVTTGTVSPAAGSASTGTIVIRSVGLASKAVVSNSVIYFLATYDSPYQPTYFLINGASTAASPKVVAKLAYQNGGGYADLGLPNATLTDSTFRTSYLIKDLIASVNKGTNLSSGTQTAGIYSQTGINLVSMNIGADSTKSVEIASDLHLSGGFLWMYDGYLPVEHSFFVYPDSVECTWSASGGSIHAQPLGSTNANVYFYQAVYEWSDNQGNIHRSAPSIPVPVTTTGSGTAGSITVNVPTLRLTYKTANPVKIVIYRWSIAQQAYYQVTSVTSATLNSTTADSISFVDTLADATILGNSLIYTTGGVIENVAAPSTKLMTLFDSRLWLVDAEDPNLLWYSKQVIETVPVEMSDLLTIYVAPTTGVQGSTGPTTAISSMDDKLIVFKKDAIYYINGRGPDNTGANDQYSQPIFITSSVGCENQDSIVLTQNGLMFQSDKGIWLLSRSLETNYIGSPVEAFNEAIVQSAVVVPETTQVRFTISTGKTLMYDYYYNQWGTFTGVPAVSACIYKGLHTFLNSYGQVYQETPSQYLDGANPVLLNLTTSWINVAGLQGYERFYSMFLLGTYYTPFTLDVQIGYDYNEIVSQSATVTPDNYSGPWGDEALWGSGGTWGGPGNTFEARVFPEQQKCEAFLITINEVYDRSFGVAAGQGLSLSGLNLIVGMKKGYRTQKASTSFG